MFLKGLKFTVGAALVIAMMAALPCSDAFADRHGGYGGGGRHYYHNGGWYRHGWFGLDMVVTALTVGALIDSLPPRYTTVVVAGTPYYYYDNYYYRPYQNGGYVVVPPPVLMQPAAPAPQMIPVGAQSVQPQAEAQGEITINIPNSRGAYTAVTLKKAGTGYVGPQGEYYSDNPTVAQLKVLYGK